MGSAPKHGKKTAARGSASDQFPGKLHDLMTCIDRVGFGNIISWVQNGKAIMVHEPERLLQILPHFGFSQTKYRSFQRQLNMWHWERTLDGPYKGAWIHPYFIRGNKVLCGFMSRHFIPTQSMIQGLLNSPEIEEGNNLIVPQMKMLSEKIEFPLQRGNGSLPTMAPLKTSQPSGDDWELLPTTFHGDTTLFDEQFLLHFDKPIEHINATPFHQSASMYEPTPIPDNSTMNQLLEPLSADVIDFLF